jgi:hypothetical protein
MHSKNNVFVHGRDTPVNKEESPVIIDDMLKLYHQLSIYLGKN